MNNASVGLRAHTCTCIGISYSIAGMAQEARVATVTMIIFPDYPMNGHAVKEGMKNK